jgi:hypothetical protein
MSAHNHQAAHLNECSTASPSMVTLVGIDIDIVLSGHQVPVARNDAPAPMARRYASINDTPIRADERRVHLPPRPTGSTEASQ